MDVVPSFCRVPQHVVPSFCRVPQHVVPSFCRVPQHAVPSFSRIPQPLTIKASCLVRSVNHSVRSPIRQDQNSQC